MAIRQIDYGTPAYKQMVQLRYDVLRKPLNLTYSEQDLAPDAHDFLMASYEDEDMDGCAILTHIDDHTARVRQMAVAEKKQRHGVGEAILRFAEGLAWDKGYKTMILHARESVIDFYKKCGYSIVSDTFTEVGLPHKKMSKNISFNTDV